jgi:hypothetical protein
MSLEQKDRELIERIIYKSGDDVAVSIARSFERLEERIDATESRLYSRLAEIEDKIEANRQKEAGELDDTRERDCIYNHDHEENQGKDCVSHD